MLDPSNLEKDNLAIIIETSKIKMIIQSIILLSMNKRINELFDSPQSNKMMDASFARKKRANKHFDPCSLENQKAWISSQQEKITSQISQLENEIKEWKDKFQTEELTIDFDISIQDFKNRIEACHAQDDLDEAYDTIQNEINGIYDIILKFTRKENNPIRKSIIAELNQDIFFEVYNDKDLSVQYFTMINIIDYINTIDKLDQLVKR